jgi:hypothetical protein
MFGKKTSKQLKRELTGKIIIFQKRSIVSHQSREFNVIPLASRDTKKIIRKK